MFGLRMLGKHQPPWYRALEGALMPVQPVVIGALLVIVAVTVFLVVKGPAWARTAWLVYLLSP